MLKIRTIFLLAILVGLGVAACDKNKEDDDPLKQIARQRYAEGRRLFLSCDPNNYSNALKAFDDALASWDEYPEALAAWAETASMWYGFRISRSIFDQAYTRAQRAIRLAPENDMGYRAMADLYRHYRDPETQKLAIPEALQAIERALQINPNSAENLYVHGSIYLPDDPEKAISILELSIKANPDLAKAYFNMGSAYQMMGDKIYMAKPDPDPLIFEEQKKKMHEYYESAAKYLRLYLKFVPDDLAGPTSLGIILLHDNQAEEAEKMFQRAVGATASPDPSQTQWRALSYVYLGQIAETRKKDLALARSYLERSKSVNPYEPQVYAHLIRISEAMGDKAGAQDYKKQFEQMVRDAKAALAAVEGGGTAGPAPGGTAPSAVAPAPLPVTPAPPEPPAATPEAPAASPVPKPGSPAAGSTVP